MTNQRLKVLHIVHQYLPEHVGGTELYTKTLAEFQASAGYRVVVFSPASKDDNWPNAVLENGVYVYRFPTGSRTRRQVFFDTLRGSELRAALASVLDREKPDLVHSQHNMGLPANLVDEIEARSIPFLITVHDYWYICGNAQLLTNYDRSICAGPDSLHFNCGRCAASRVSLSPDQLFGLPAAPFMASRNRKLRRILDSARQVIFPSHFTRQMYESFGLAGKKSVVVPHGCIVPEKMPAPDTGRHYSPSSITGEAPHLRVGYVGSLAWQKGVHILLDAANRLPVEGVTIDIFGSLTSYPAYSERLRQMSQHPGITFHGQIDHDLLWSKLAALDVLVFPTLWYESFGLIIQEAFSVGLPLVASRIGAVEENIKDGLDGLLFPAGDVVALLKILMDLYRDPARLEVLRKGIGPVRTMAAHLTDVSGVYAKVLGRPVTI